MSVRPLQGWSSSDRTLFSDLGPNFHSWPILAQLQWSQQIKYDLKTTCLLCCGRVEMHILSGLFGSVQERSIKLQKVLQFLIWKKILGKPYIIRIIDLLCHEMGERERETSFKATAQTLRNENFTLCSKLQHFHACSFAAANCYLGIRTLD